jgi:hypothetical protein
MLTVKLVSGEILSGGSWNTLPDKPIQAVVLELQGRRIKMQGFEEYNFLREYAYKVIGNGLNQMIGIYLMGRKNEEVTILKYNTMTNEITQSVNLIGKEYNGRPSTGWKQGNSASTPQCYIN